MVVAGLSIPVQVASIRLRPAETGWFPPMQPGYLTGMFRLIGIIVVALIVLSFLGVVVVR